jgi:hypothetical protein
MEHESDGDWCSINEAARRLKVTPTAIRNRIKRGTLETKPNGNHGRLVRVPLTVPLTVTGTGSDTVPPTVTDIVRPPNDGPSVIDVLNRLTERLEAELASARAERDVERERAGREAERAAGLAVEAAAAEVLRGTVEVLRRALESERDLRMEIILRERDRARPWWRRLSLAGG